jgi:hypothetical protein
MMSDWVGFGVVVFIGVVASVIGLRRRRRGALSGEGGPIVGTSSGGSHHGHSTHHGGFDGGGGHHGGGFDGGGGHH